MASKYFLSAVLLATSVLASPQFITVTNIKTVVARAASSAASSGSSCDPSPSGGLPPICLTDFGSFDPASFEYSTTISTAEDKTSYAETTEKATSNTVTISVASSTGAKSSTTSKASTSVFDPPCYMYADPDNNVKGVCMCTNGATVAPVTTGSDLCPWSTIPPQALTTAKPTTTNNRQYQYTYTDLSKKVIECETYTVNDYAGYAVSFCAGSSAVLYEPPVATMELGSSQVNVGSTMTGEALFTSVSNALTSLCPTPTSQGAWTACQTGTVTVGKAAYLNNGEPEDGDVTLKVTDAQYNDTNHWNLFINMIAGAANASATGSNCKPIDWSYVTDVGKREERDIFGRMIAPPEPIQHKGTSTFCNMNGFLDTQWYNGVQETAQMWFETEFGFELSELGNFDCGSTVDLVGDVIGAIFDAIFPEFAWLITTGVELGALACEAAETFNPTKSKREIEDARLAKAWAKELKKDRKLPMPEHKKRELGLIES